VKKTCFIKLVVLAGSCSALATTRACAQFEVAPDHFESSGMVSLSAPEQKGAHFETENFRFSGGPRLRYEVQCAGKEQALGNHSCALSADGKNALQSRGRQIMENAAAMGAKYVSGDAMRFSLTELARRAAALKHFSTLRVWLSLRDLVLETWP
jgi:hypothetical protein